MFKIVSRNLYIYSLPHQGIKYTQTHTHKEKKSDEQNKTALIMISKLRYREIMVKHNTKEHSKTY